MGGAGAAAAAAAGSGHRHGHGTSDYDRTTGSSGLTGSNTTGTGYGSSDYGSNTGSSTTAGPHSSNLANKADPRVDSDLDGRRGLESNTRATGSTGSGLTGSTGHHGHHGGVTGRAEDIIHGGDHHTETANRLDPHVSGGRGGLEHATVEGTGSGLGGSHNTSGGYGSSTGTTGGYGSSSGTAAGPHSSNLANKADPRVDSDLDGRRGLESNTGTHNTSSGYGSGSGIGSTAGGYGSTSGTSAGPHSSNLANKTDPRVDSDLDGRRGVESTSGGYGSGSGTHTGSGYNDNTSSSTGTGSANAEPHKSGMMNKLDPRVG